MMGMSPLFLNFSLTKGETHMTGKIFFDPFSFDLSKNAIGFDTMLKRLQEANEYLPKIPSYPPYNIKKVDDEHFVIEIALAGFGKQNLNIELKDDTLTVSGQVDNEDKDYIFQGIANRAFTRKFTLADTVVVKNAEMANGLLKIFLERFIPEEKKAKRIDILDPFGVGETTRQLLTESGKAWAETAQKMASNMTPK
jgi:molecular chaperone IbpA